MFCKTTVMTFIQQHVKDRGAKTLFHIWSDPELVALIFGANVDTVLLVYGPSKLPSWTCVWSSHVLWLLAMLWETILSGIAPVISLYFSRYNGEDRMFLSGIYFPDSNHFTMYYIIWESPFLRQNKTKLLCHHFLFQIYNSLSVWWWWELSSIVIPFLWDFSSITVLSKLLPHSSQLSIQYGDMEYALTVVKMEQHLIIKPLEFFFSLTIERLFQRHHKTAVGLILLVLRIDRIFFKSVQDFLQQVLNISWLTVLTQLIPQYTNYSWKVLFPLL